MESSSIVSFNNDSTFQTTLKGEYNNISVHELALHAMRDRCLLLQRRINVLENDNMRLKLDITKITENTPYVPLREDEKTSLLEKISELNKQKSQLLHHVFMVSCENKNLWNKLSTLKSVDKSLNKLHTKQTMLRSNNYLHSTPKTSANYQEKYSESSLEEISLKLINSYIQEKSQLVEQYEQMTELQDFNEDNFDSIGFTYMEDPATDSLKEIHMHTNKLQNLKKELAEQEEHLKLIISRVESVLKDGYKCPTCISNNVKVITSEHKEIETSESLVNWTTPLETTNYNNYSDTAAIRKNISNKKDTENEDRENMDKRHQNIRISQCLCIIVIKH
ncbi:hypothetical protein ACJJTC_008287 [Scirpophaga incertulas]